MRPMGIVVLVLIVLALVLIGGAVLGLVFSLLWWVLIGLLIGALARLVLPGDRGLSLLATALFGIAGSLLGGIIANAADLGSILQFVVAVLVAAILIAVFSNDRRSRIAQ